MPDRLVASPCRASTWVQEYCSTCQITVLFLCLERFQCRRKQFHIARSLACLGAFCFVGCLSFGAAYPGNPPQKINVASFHWLRRVEEICHRNNILVIVDDIQAGCGRTGSFFSFTPAGMTPDIITLSKSLGAYGLPFSVVLLRPHLDCWDPGEHNGTFRGNNLAFVAATEALRLYWTDTAFSQTVRHKAQILRHELDNIIGTMPPDMALVRGRGLMCGMVFEHDAKLAKLITAEAFQRGLILETCGARDQVVKFLPPLIIDESLLLEGIAILRESVASVLAACRNHKNEIDNTLAQEVST